MRSPHVGVKARVLFLTLHKTNSKRIKVLAARVDTLKLIYKYGEKISANQALQIKRPRLRNLPPGLRMGLNGAWEAAQQTKQLSEETRSSPSVQLMDDEGLEYPQIRNNYTIASVSLLVT